MKINKDNIENMTHDINNTLHDLRLALCELTEYLHTDNPDVFGMLTVRLHDLSMYLAQLTFAHICKIRGI